MALNSYGSIYASAIRLVKLDDCCNPLPSGTVDSVLVVDNELVRVTVAPSYRDRTITERENGRGQVCLKSSTNSQLEDIQVTVDLCSVMPELVEAITGQSLVTNAAGEVTGFTFDREEITNRVGIEVWGDVIGDDCADGGAPLYSWLSLPCTFNWRPNADLSFEADDFIEFSFVGFTEPGSYSDLFGVLDNPPAVGQDAIWSVVETAPPAAGCFPMP